MRPDTPSLVLTAVSVSLVSALRIAPGSPCARYCGNVLSSTAKDEIPCDTATIKKTSTGFVWEQCIQCLATSTYVAENKETDLQWLLYNLRLNSLHCFYNGPTNPCVTRLACGELQDAITYQNFSTSVGAFDYCRNWEQDMLHNNCAPCLAQMDDGIIKSNYMLILEAACEQKPESGRTLSIEGDIFGDKQIKIVPPEPALSSLPTPDYGPVSLGARVGIAFGGLAFILALTGFCIVMNGKRRRKRFLRELKARQAGERGAGGGQNWSHPKTRYGGSPSSGPDMFETPVSQRPLRSWDNESPVSAGTDGPFPRYFSPYTSQFNSPVSVSTTANWPTVPLTQQQIDQMMAALNQQYQTQQLSSSPPPPPPPPPPPSPPPPPQQQQQQQQQQQGWPTASQEKIFMQMQGQREQQMGNGLGIVLGGEDANLQSKTSNQSLGNTIRINLDNLNENGYPIESKGKEPERGVELYELREVESPYGGSQGRQQQQQQGAVGTYAYSTPSLPQAKVPVLQHPGYGRSRKGSREQLAQTGVEVS